ncbi:response regulator transcription factor [Clostridium beijerinckii]|nr:response regulator [Clostridium beijerinckii]
MYGVLIADDEPLMRASLKVMISKVEGFEVLYSVGSGEQAVEICKNNKIDIVFMDIMMPGESGIESSKKIYTINPSTTIFIVSSYNSFDFAIEALKTKVKEYISKPVSFSQIEKLLSNYKDENQNVKSEIEGNKYDSLLLIIKEKNYKKMYYEIPKIIDEMCSSKKSDTKLLREEFMQIGENLINSVQLLNKKPKKLNELFPMEEDLGNEKRFLEFWLFKVMNYVFQQNSIKKYSILNDVFSYIENNI